MKFILSIFGLLSFGLSFACADDLTPVPNFGRNPGEIIMHKYVPDNVPPNAPLVVSLHGCLQNAAAYSNVGWKTLADQWKFYIVFPEQPTGNNSNSCWNWFQADDIQRGQGEIESIIEMIAKMKSDYSIDAGRIYIEGLSAGGWMVPALLASYPDVFAGGAINAGGPAFCAMTEKYFWDIFGWWNLWDGYRKAKKCMDGIDKLPSAWGDLVRNKGYREYSGSWPIVSIWQGSADSIVDAINQQELVDQWTNVHEIDSMFDASENLGAETNVIHKEYHDSEGQVLVETYLISGMQHGAPIKVDSEKSCGEESEYILNAGICGVRHIGQFWGLDK